MAKINSGLARKLVIGAVLGGGAVEGAARLGSHVSMISKQDKAYTDMFNKVPQLKEYDKEKVDDYFNVVKTFSPSMATNGLVAGNLVNKMILQSGVDSRLVGEISKVHKDIKSVPVYTGIGRTVFEKGIVGMVPGASDVFGG